MGEQLALRVHHVGVAAPAHVDLGDHLLDGLQADLGRGDLDGVLPDGDGEGQVGLDAVLEVHRAPVRLTRPRLEELRRLREVLLAPRGVQRQPRDAELLLARHVEMAQLVDRRHVAEEAQEVELALLGQGRAEPPAEGELPEPELGRRGVVGGGPRGLAHPTLGVPDELLDLGRRGRGRRALHPDDRPLGLLVDEVQLDQARGHQHAAHQADEDDDVLPEQPAACGGRRRAAPADGPLTAGTSPRAA